MKAISKAQVIDLMDNINREGMDNSHWDINVRISETNADKFYDADGAGVILKPGAYCAIWFDEDDFSDFPSLNKWIDNSLTEENIVLLDNGKGWIVLICLELL